MVSTLLVTVLVAIAFQAQADDGPGHGPGHGHGHGHGPGRGPGGPEGPMMGRSCLNMREMMKDVKMKTALDQCKTEKLGPAMMDCITKSVGMTKEDGSIDYAACREYYEKYAEPTNKDQVMAVFDECAGKAAPNDNLTTFSKCQMEEGKGKNVPCNFGPGGRPPPGGPWGRPWGGPRGPMMGPSCLNISEMMNDEKFKTALDQCKTEGMGPAMMDCMMKAMGTTNEDGSINYAVSREYYEKYAEPTNKDKVLAIFDECAGKAAPNDNLMSFSRCQMEEAKANNVTCHIGPGGRRPQHGPWGGPPRGPWGKPSVGAEGSEGPKEPGPDGDEPVTEA